MSSVSLNESAEVYSVGDLVTVKDPFGGPNIVGKVIEADEEEGIYLYSIELIHKHPKGFKTMEVSQGAIVGFSGQPETKERVVH